jgi:hypothetical protein
MMKYCENPVHRGIIFFDEYHLSLPAWPLIVLIQPTRATIPQVAKQQQETIHDI